MRIAAALVIGWMALTSAECWAADLMFGNASETAAPSAYSLPPIMADQAADESNVYATPPPPEGVNSGGGHLDLNFIYVNRYVYRGVDHDALSRGNNLNLLLEGRLSFDFGSYPHPFVGLFANIDDADPVSRFQEFRPQAGLTWNLRPFLLEGGGTDYIYPQRESFNTEEVYFRLGIDDSLLFHTTDPILSPYVLSVYDYHINQGWYLEWGVKHDFTFDSLGMIITVEANIAYVNAIRTQFVFTNQVKDTGWQHAEVGLIGSYSLNNLLHLGKRFGEFDAKGYLFYDDKLQRHITANYVLWGGAGIGFKY